jgi:hypothetical protein
MLKEHKPMHDVEVNRFILESFTQLTDKNLNLATWHTDNHLTIFKHWINSSTCRKIYGLHEFRYQALCSGTSQAIENFINRNQKRRLRFSRNEFVLSKIICNVNSVDWCCLEDQDITENDAVVISWPFSGNGGIYPGVQDLIKSCERYNVPVLVDAAYFGISSDIEIDVTSTCISDVCVSLSKPFSTMLRHGIRFTRLSHDDLLQNTSDQGIINRPAVVVSSKLMEQFDADYIVKKYLSRHKEICQYNNLTSTPTLTLAVGDKNIYSEFNRGDFVRVCITNELLA